MKSGAVLVDTSAWIDHFGNRGSGAALQLAQWLSDEPDRIVLNAVVIAELLRGVRNDTAADRVLAMLKTLQQADDVRHDDWLVSARIFRICRNAGLTIRSPLDCLIAAHAMRLGIAVLAVDRDFGAIASHVPLRLYATPAH